MSTPERKLNTTQLLTMIRRTRSFSKVDQELHRLSSPTEFCHYLYKLMTERELKVKDVVSESGMERSYFYHILSGKKVPSRNVILRIALCIGTTLAETNRMLLLAAQGTLYAKIRRDAAIIYSIERKYTMRQTNEFLMELGEAPLYKEN